MTAASSGEDFAWLLPLIVSSLASLPLATVVVYADPMATAGRRTTAVAPRASPDGGRCASDGDASDGDICDCGDCGDGELGVSGAAAEHWFRSRVGFAGWRLLDSLGLAKRVTIKVWRPPAFEAAFYHNSVSDSGGGTGGGSGGYGGARALRVERSERWPPAAHVAFAGVGPAPARRSTTSGGGGTSGGSGGVLRGGAPYSLRVPPGTLVAGAAALACGVRAIERAQKLAQSIARQLHASPWDGGAAAPNVTAVAFLADDSAACTGSCPSPVAALLTETGPFEAQVSRAAAGVGGEEDGGAAWRRVAATLAGGHRSGFAGGGGGGVDGGTAALTFGVGLGRPLLAGTGTVLRAAPTRGFAMSGRRGGGAAVADFFGAGTPVPVAVPAVLAAHPLWRAMVPLFAPEVQAALGR